MQRSNYLFCISIVKNSKIIYKIFIAPSFPTWLNDPGIIAITIKTTNTCFLVDVYVQQTRGLDCKSEKFEKYLKLIRIYVYLVDSCIWITHKRKILVHDQQTLNVYCFMVLLTCVEFPIWLFPLILSMQCIINISGSKHWTDLLIMGPLLEISEIYLITSPTLHAVSY